MSKSSTSPSLLRSVLKSVQKVAEVTPSAIFEASLRGAATVSSSAFLEVAQKADPSTPVQQALSGAIGALTDCADLATFTTSYGIKQSKLLHYVAEKNCPLAETLIQHGVQFAGKLHSATPLSLYDASVFSAEQSPATLALQHQACHFAIIASVFGGPGLSLAYNDLVAFKPSYGTLPSLQYQEAQQSQSIEKSDKEEGIQRDESVEKSANDNIDDDSAGMCDDGDPISKKSIKGGEDPLSTPCSSFSSTDAVFPFTTAIVTRNIEDLTCIWSALVTGEVALDDVHAPSADRIFRSMLVNPFAVSSEEKEENEKKEEMIRKKGKVVEGESSPVKREEIGEKEIKNEQPKEDEGKNADSAADQDHSIGLSHTNFDADDDDDDTMKGEPNLTVFAGNSGSNSEMTIGVPTSWFNGGSYAYLMERLTTSSSSGKNSGGIKIQEIEILWELEEAVEAARILRAKAMASVFEAIPQFSGIFEELPFSVKQVVNEGREISDSQIETAKLGISNFQKYVAAQFDELGLDNIMTPVLATPYQSGQLLSVAYTIPFTLAGNPVIAMRLPHGGGHSSDLYSRNPFRSKTSSSEGKNKKKDIEKRMMGLQEGGTEEEDDGEGIVSPESTYPVVQLIGEMGRDSGLIRDAQGIWDFCVANPPKRNRRRSSLSFFSSLRK